MSEAVSVSEVRGFQVSEAVPESEVLISPLSESEVPKNRFGHGVGHELMSELLSVSTDL